MKRLISITIAALFVAAGAHAESDFSLFARSLTPDVIPNLADSADESNRSRAATRLIEEERRGASLVSSKLYEESRRRDMTEKAYVREMESRISMKYKVQ